jgi:uncharacterized protein YoxC
MAAEPPMDERKIRVERRMDGIARDIDIVKTDVNVLKADVKELKHDVVGVKQELLAIHHRIDVVVEHVDDGFRRQAELMQSIDERHERRAAESRTEHQREMQLLRDVLGNHEGRIRKLEDASNRPS